MDEKINIQKLNELEKEGAIDARTASELRTLDSHGVKVRWSADNSQYEYIGSDGFTYSGDVAKGTRKGILRGANKKHRAVSDAMELLRSTGGFEKEKRKEEEKNTGSTSYVPKSFNTSVESPTLVAKVGNAENAASSASSGIEDGDGEDIKIGNKSTPDFVIYDDLPSADTQEYNAKQRELAKKYKYIVPIDPSSYIGRTENSPGEFFNKGYIAYNELPEAQVSDDFKELVEKYPEYYTQYKNSNQYIIDQASGLGPGAGFYNYGKSDISARDGKFNSQGEFWGKDTKVGSSGRAYDKTREMGDLTWDVDYEDFGKNYSSNFAQAANALSFVSGVRGFWNLGKAMPTAGRALGKTYKGTKDVLSKVNLKKPVSLVKKGVTKTKEGIKKGAKSVRDAYKSGKTGYDYNAYPKGVGPYEASSLPPRTLLGPKSAWPSPYSFKPPTLEQLLGVNKLKVSMPFQHVPTLGPGFKKGGKTPIFAKGGKIQKFQSGKFIPNMQANPNAFTAPKSGVTLGGLNLDELGRLNAPDKINVTKVNLNPEAGRLVEKSTPTTGEETGSLNSNQYSHTGNPNQVQEGTYDYVKTPIGDFGYGEIADLGTRLATMKKAKFVKPTLAPHGQLQEQKGVVERGLSSEAAAAYDTESANLQAGVDNTADVGANKDEAIRRALGARDIQMEKIAANEAARISQEEMNRATENANIGQENETQRLNEALVQKDAYNTARNINANQGANDKFVSMVGDAIMSTRQRAGYNKDVSRANSRTELDRYYADRVEDLNLSGLDPNSPEYITAKRKLFEDYQNLRKKFVTGEGAADAYNLRPR